jgi:hypothetical protein
VPAAGTEIKILYSTETTYTNYDDIPYTNETSTTYAQTKTFPYVEPTWADDNFTDYLGVNYRFDIDDLSFIVSNITNIENGDHFSLTGTSDWWAEDIKVFKENPATIKVYWIGGYSSNKWSHAENDGEIKINITNLEMTMTITPPNHTDVHVDWIHLAVDYNITALYDTTPGLWNVTIELDINGVGLKDGQLYTEHIPGRYEWTVLGRDAHTSDSLGATLVTAAFKNKQIEIGLSGLDMMYYEWMNPSIPYVMNCFGTAPGSRGDYKDDGSTPGQRPALRDDWCTTWPITSSNMIGVGGPLANMFTLYFNEFTDAFYGTYVTGWGETYTSYATWQNKIAALTCWNGSKKGYVATYDTGYAVIATYKDLNGTVGLVIWGLGPRDTYYASKFFHEEIIYELQSFPLCVTSIILKIDYTDPLHPGFSIVECLGTISETLVETTKGGIHDP